MSAVKIEKALLTGIMQGRIKMEDTVGTSGWVKIDAFCLYLTPSGVHFDFRAGGDIVATIEHPANLRQGGTLMLDAGSGFEMRLQLTFTE